jgi:DNA-binding transcriptional regulator YbjK
MAAGFKLKEDEPMPNPSLADPRIQSGLKSAYGSQVGRIKLMQQLIQLPNNPQRWETLRKELIQAQNISDAKLVALANARAKNAQDVFLKKAPDMKNRVQMGQVQVVKSDSAGVPVGISLITQ